MKLIQREDVKWDIVRSTIKSKPWLVLGWPISAYTSTSRTLFRIGKDDYGSERRYLEVRIPFTPRVTWIWDGEYVSKENMYPTVSHRTIRFCWNGFLWFWRES